MAFDQELAARVRTVLGNRSDVEEKKMFGGLTFMVSGHMCCGVLKDELIVRMAPETAAEAIATPDARLFDFTG
ncbi:MAG: TfoX/Sxy family protein, partial [Rhodospirillales bacterium]|nr:TfoX/Sxy family protein [Rhodospirillales bacterium]